MPSKPLKVSFSVSAENAEEAIASLFGRFLRTGRGGCKIIREQTNFSLVDLCKSLIDDWKSGKVAFVNGEVTLTFTSGKLAAEADLLVYAPEQGDRFLYTGGAIASVAQRVLARESAPDALTNSGNLTQLTQSLQTVAEALAELAANHRSVESRLQHLQNQNQSSTTTSQDNLSDLSDVDTAINQALITQSTAFAQQLQAALDAQAGIFAQILSSQLTSTALHFNKRLDTMQAQLDQLTIQLKDLELTEFTSPAIPKTEAEWLDRIKITWGTVGDYEQYSFSHRAANAETPLFYTPDWVALCELDWARKLHSTLALLYELIHGDDGIGYSGADILQQFGCHLDPETNERYYIYHLGGFTAYEALWQTVYNPQYSWLPELQHLSARISNQHHKIFEMFGWEEDAIASLEHVVKRATYEWQSGQQSTYDTHSQPSESLENIVSSYLALLNIGPFTPITLETIKRAYRQAMKAAHPDTGGSKELAQRINEAYEAVLNHYFPQAT